MKVQFKFDEAAPPAERKKVIDAITDQGAANVEPLFGREADPELASLYTADYTDGHDPTPLLSTLEDSDAVEFVEQEALRKLIRGTGP